MRNVVLVSSAQYADCDIHRALVICREPNSDGDMVRWRKMVQEAGKTAGAMPTFLTSTKVDMQAFKICKVS
jgi:hypothetical protein